MEIRPSSGGTVARYQLGQTLPSNAEGSSGIFTTDTRDGYKVVDQYLPMNGTNRHDDDEVPPGARDGAAGDDQRGFFQELKEKIAEGIADGIEVLSKIPFLKSLGYKLYGAFTKPKDDVPPLKNVGELSPTLLRGAQPTAEGLARLKAEGVNTIINLRPETQSEKPIVEEQGMRYVYLPLPAVGAPTNEQALRFLNLVTDPEIGKSYFHCQRGIDRTGSMAAVYRIAVQGWSLEQAAAEMRQFGYKEGFEDDKLDFLRDFDSYWRSLLAAEKARVLHQAPTPA